MNFMLVLLTRDSKIFETEHPVRKPNDPGKPASIGGRLGKHGINACSYTQNRLPA
jgi:hypothetical protein